MQMEGRALRSDSCYFEGEKIWNLIFYRNLARSSCRSSEVSVWKSHLQETAKLNAYADVKLAVPVSELEPRNWWNRREQAEYR
jgi:hypothetical protein